MDPRYVRMVATTMPIGCFSICIMVVQTLMTAICYLGHVGTVAATIPIGCFSICIMFVQMWMSASQYLEYVRTAAATTPRVASAVTVTPAMRPVRTEKLAMVSCSSQLICECTEGWLADLLTAWLALSLYLSVKICHFLFACLFVFVCLFFYRLTKSCKVNLV